VKVAIYTRQSFDKKDSVSIESQINSCKNICDNNNWEYEIFIDKGFSGSNTNRPEFKRMMGLIKDGQINKVIAYRLDRISRSLADFVNLITIFNDNNAEFMSATENIDNNSPMGRAMINIVMTFAQLERETISQRIKDSTRYRALQGNFVGGKIVLGYDKNQMIINGKKTPSLKVNEDESKIIAMIFDKYLEAGMSIRKLAIWLNDNGYKTKSGKYFDHTRLPEILRNTLYVKAGQDIYNYFLSRNIMIESIRDDFNNDNGVIAFNKTIKDNNLKDVVIVVGKHKGIVDSYKWIEVQEKLSKNKSFAPREGQSKLSVLSGLVRCSHCGKVMMTKSTTTKRNKPYIHFSCGSSILNACDNKGCIQAGKIENIVELELIKYCNEFKNLKSIKTDNIDYSLINAKKSVLISEIDVIESKISRLILQLIEDDCLTDYIKSEVTKLDIRKKEIINELQIQDEQVRINENKKMNIEILNKQVFNFQTMYNNADFDEKKDILRSIVKSIMIDKENVNIDFFEFALNGNNLLFGAERITNNYYVIRHN